MGNPFVFSAVFAIGPDRVPFVAQYDEWGGFVAELKSPARLGTVSEILHQNGVEIPGSAPQFVKDIAEVEATLLDLSFKATHAARIKLDDQGTPQVELIDPDSPHPPAVEALKTGKIELRDIAAAKPDGAPRGKELWIDNERRTDWLLAQIDGKTYDLSRKTFTIAFVARYGQPLELIKGLIALDHVAIGFSTDPTTTVQEIQQRVQDGLARRFGGSAPAALAQAAPPALPAPAAPAAPAAAG